MPRWNVLPVGSADDSVRALEDQGLATLTALGLIIGLDYPKALITELASLAEENHIEKFPAFHAIERVQQWRQNLRH